MPLHNRRTETRAKLLRPVKRGLSVRRTCFCLSSSASSESKDPISTIDLPPRFPHRGRTTHLRRHASQSQLLADQILHALAITSDCGTLPSAGNANISPPHNHPRGEININLPAGNNGFFLRATASANCARSRFTRSGTSIQKIRCCMHCADTSAKSLPQSPAESLCLQAVTACSRLEPVPKLKPLTITSPGARAAANCGS